MKGGGERLLRRSKIAEELFQATKLQMGNILDTAGDHRRALYAALVCWSLTRLDHSHSSGRVAELSHLRLSEECL